jgi:AcrR family transcriptional regulator
MNHDMARKYTSSARQEGKLDTRDRILDAVVAVVTRQGVLAFTVQNVANAAGVALRTVYRHFATREALLDGLDELLERRATEAGITLPTPADLAELPQRVRAVYQSFDAFRDAMRAYVIISIALGRRVPSFDRRTRTFRQSMARAFPGLTRKEVREAAGMIRLLGSTRTWFLLTIEQGMTTGAAAHTASWAMEALFADLATRSRQRTP